MLHLGIIDLAHVSRKKVLIDLCVLSTIHTAMHGPIVYSEELMRVVVLQM